MALNAMMPLLQSVAWNFIMLLLFAVHGTPSLDASLNKTIKVGSTVLISCKLHGLTKARWDYYPPGEERPVSIYNGYSVNTVYPPTSRYRLNLSTANETHRTSDLVITDVQLSDAGMYSCSSNIDEEYRQDVYLAVFNCSTHFSVASSVVEMRCLVNASVEIRTDISCSPYNFTDVSIALRRESANMSGPPLTAESEMSGTILSCIVTTNHSDVWTSEQATNGSHFLWHSVIAVGSIIIVFVLVILAAICICSRVKRTEAAYAEVVRPRMQHLPSTNSNRAEFQTVDLLSSTSVSSAPSSRSTRSLRSVSKNSATEQRTDVASRCGPQYADLAGITKSANDSHLSSSVHDSRSAVAVYADIRHSTTAAVGPTIDNNYRNVTNTTETGL